MMERKSRPKRKLYSKEDLLRPESVRRQSLPDIRESGADVSKFRHLRLFLDCSWNAKRPVSEQCKLLAGGRSTHEKPLIH